MKILLADDDPISLHLLEKSLAHLQSEIVLAHNGQEAWQHLTATPPPDLALLDWMMPELDGPDICHLLRAKQVNHFTYIILVTSNDRPEYITIGLDAGANDYIIKPFNQDELRSRVAVGLRVVNYENSLRIVNERLTEYSRDLEQLAEERAQQLVRADRMVVLGTMAAGIAHEINNPLTVVQGNLGLLKHFWRQFGDQALRGIQADLASGQGYDLKHLDVRDMLDSMERSIHSLRNIVDGMRTLSHGGGGKIEALDHLRCLQDAIQISLPKTKRLCPVAVETQDVPFRVLANPVQITQILVNLIANAADALADTPAPAIIARAYPDQLRLCLSIQDNGPGIPPEHLEKIWNPLFTSKPMGQGTGLGLAICQEIAQAHGGTLHVASQPGQGATFTLCLPNEADYAKLVSGRQDSASPASASGTPAANNR